MKIVVVGSLAAAQYRFAREQAIDAGARARIIRMTLSQLYLDYRAQAEALGLTYALYQKTWTADTRDQAANALLKACLPLHSLIIHRADLNFEAADMVMTPFDSYAGSASHEQDARDGMTVMVRKMIKSNRRAKIFIIDDSGHTEAALLRIVARREFNLSA
jgi:hypothetical protein